MEGLSNGEIVKAHYRSGSYIGKIVEDRGENYLIEVHAVAKHPLQGDLHNFGQLDNVVFQQRKALAFREKMNVKKAAVKPFEGDFESYGTTLKEAVDVYKDKLKEDPTDFNKASLEKLEELEERHYVKQYV